MFFRRPLCLAVLGIAAAMAPVQQAAASLVWTWSYTGANTVAAGTFTTADTADSQGFYQVTGITGTRNGANITSLWTTGVGTPGNEAFPVDNLVSMGAQQLTGHGIGFATDAGSYANLFFADWLSPAGTVEYATFEPNPALNFSEVAVDFTANRIPEPQSLALVLLALAGLGWTRRRRVQ